MPKIHHIAIEIDKLKTPNERFLWETLGYGCPYAMTRLVKGRHWMIGGGSAINLLPRDEPVLPRDGHICIDIDDHERFEYVVRTLDGPFKKMYGWTWEEGERHLNFRRLFITAPSGYQIEVLQSAPPIRTAPIDKGVY